jgi:hypothetical protein
MGASLGQSRGLRPLDGWRYPSTSPASLRKALGYMMVSMRTQMSYLDASLLFSNVVLRDFVLPLENFVAICKYVSKMVAS